MTTARSTSPEELGNLPTTGLAAAPSSGTAPDPQDGRPGSEDPSRLVGQVIAGRYRVDKVLGEGGMGAVLRCHHLGLKRDVAVKVLRSELTSDPEIAARFEREAQSGSRLEHPNCVRVFDFGRWTPSEGPALQYLAMQLLDGKELADMLGKPLEWTRAVELTLQILRGLAHAHDRGIVHRDLKPENVFVTQDHDGKETLKLVDFGIAKIVAGEGANSGMTRAGLVFGTPRYMSPEQALGAEVDLRTDIYAAGIVLYQMLSGRPPFDSDDFVTLLRLQIGAEPPPLPSHLPGELVAIVERMLAKERDQRFASAHAVIGALEAVLSAAFEPAPASSSSHSVAAPTTLATQGASSSVTYGTGLSLARPTGASLRLRRPGLVAAAGVGGLSLFLLAWGLGASDDAEPQDVPSDETSLVAAEVAASDFALADLDEQISRGDRKAARHRVEELLRAFPDDARLHVRRARLSMAAGRAVDALDAYEKAMALDGRLLEDEPFEKELLTAMRHPTARARAMKIALGDTGGRVRVFLLERVNDEVEPLAWSQRHAALDTLNTDFVHVMKVDRKLQLALDLWQAPQAPDPCKAFDDGLSSIEKAPDPYYVGTLQSVAAPSPKKGASPEVAARCAAAAAHLETVRNQHKEEFDLPPAEWTVPKAYESQKKKPKRRRGGLFRRLFR